MVTATLAKTEIVLSGKQPQLPSPKIASSSVAVTMFGVAVVSDVGSTVATAYWLTSLLVDGKKAPNPQGPNDPNTARHVTIVKSLCILVSFATSSNPQSFDWSFLPVRNSFSFVVFPLFWEPRHIASVPQRDWKPALPSASGFP